MSEKTSLLQSIPPVQRTSAQEEPVSLLSRTDTIQTDRGAAAKQNLIVDGAEATPSFESPGIVGSTSVSQEPVTHTISVFQYLTYASFVLNFLLAGFVAVILFKKVSQLVEERFTASFKAFGIAAILVLLHGFFATYMFASHLNDPTRPIPLLLTMAVWIILGPVAGFITRNLLARGEKPNQNAAYMDSGFYVLVFLLATIGLSSSVRVNAVLVFTILACFLIIVPIARSLTVYKKAIARHPELRGTESKVLVYSLLFIPALLPLLAFINACGLSDGLTLFLINFITFDFVLIVGLLLILVAGRFVNEAGADLDVSEHASAGNAAPSSRATQPSRAGSKSSTNPVGRGNSDDPIIQFLNSEEGERAAEKASPTKKASPVPGIQPPRKPVHPRLSPGPAQSSNSDSKPIDPSKLKAPAKPKKRS